MGYNLIFVANLFFEMFIFKHIIKCKKEKSKMLIAPNIPIKSNNNYPISTPSINFRGDLTIKATKAVTQTGEKLISKDEINILNNQLKQICKKTDKLIIRIGKLKEQTLKIMESGKKMSNIFYELRIKGKINNETFNERFFPTAPSENGVESISPFNILSKLFENLAAN